MNLPANPWPTLTFHQKIIVILSALCFVGLLVLGVMALILRQRLQAAAGAPSQAATLPAAVCRPATLTLGETTFLIRDLNRAADGFLAVPLNMPGIAYRVEGSDRQAVFVLSPTPENLAVVSTIPLGSLVTVTWSDCTFSTYRVSAHEPGTFHASAPAAPSQNGLAVFFPLDASGVGFVFTARSSGEQISVMSPPAPSIENTQPPSALDANSPPMESMFPTPDYSQIQAEIGVLDIITSPDEKNITLNISIYNYGTSSVTLSISNVSLTQPDGTPLAMVSSEPALPKQVAPAVTETFSLTFARPSSAIATLKIFTVEYDLEDY